MKKLNIGLAFIAISLLSLAGFTAANSNSNAKNTGNQFECVGKVLVNNKEKFTCVLISSKYVLVSANDFVKFKTRPETVPGTTSVISYAPYDEKIINLKNVKVEFKGKDYNCKKLFIYPVYEKDLKSSNCDIALLELKEEVKDINPAAINTSQDEVHSKVIDISDTSFGNKNPNNLVDTTMGYQINNKSTLLVSTLDIPIAAATGPNMQEDGVLFAQTTNGWQLTGIGEANEYTFGKNGDYKLKATTWTRVSVFADWIAKTISRN